jgi:hypothetical protein
MRKSTSTVNPAAPATASQFVEVPDGWVPPGGYDRCSQWALDNRVALEYYAQQIGSAGTAAEQLQRFLASHPEILNDGDA